MRRLRAILVGSLLAFTLNAAPAHASVKKAGGIALVVAGGLLIGGGVILYAVRYNAEELGSAAPAIVVGSVGIASIVTGTIILSSGKSEQKKSSLHLTPMHHGIALAYRF